MTSSTVQIARWRRYGKDRLYLTLPDETKLGFWDLVSDEPHPDSPEHLGAITAAVGEWKAQHPSGEACLAAKATVVNEGGPWLDLTTNKAGEQAREQALAARSSAPVKTLLARALHVHTDERAWRIGADGEEIVARELGKVAKQDPRWRFLHAIPVGSRGSDIDHLVVGPGGIFTVNTKHHPRAKIWVGGNTFLVDGHRQPYIRNSRHEATRAAGLLSAACGFPVHVEGLIVTVNATDVVVKNEPQGVHVVYRKQLAAWLLRHGESLTEEHLEQVFDMARRSTTWRS